MTWNPQTGVNDLDEIRSSLKLSQDYEQQMQDPVTQTGSLAMTHIPHLCDEVERLRLEVNWFRQLAALPIPDLSCCGNCSVQHAAIRTVRSLPMFEQWQKKQEAKA